MINTVVTCCYNFLKRNFLIFKSMAEIYQIPDGNSGNANAGGIPFSIPLGGNNGGLFGGNGTNLIDLFGFAIIASIFGWGNGGFGGGFGGNGGAGFLANQLNNDSGRELIMNAVNANGEASRSAIQNLATMLGQDYATVNAAVQNVQNSLATLAAQQGMSTLQIQNSIQAGNMALAQQFANCCCENKLAIANQTAQLQQAVNGVGQQVAAFGAADTLAICQQTNTLQNGANANTQAILNKLSEMQTQTLQDKLDAARNENSQLRGEISQGQQNQYIAGVVGQALAPVNAQLIALGKEVETLKTKMPNTVPVQYPNLVAVNNTPYTGGYGYGNGFGNNVYF